MEEKFIEFLKENGVHDEFCKEHSIQSHNHPLSEFLQESDVAPKDWVKSAFFWGRAEKGFDYWDKISDSWNEIVND